MRVGQGFETVEVSGKAAGLLRIRALSTISGRFNKNHRVYGYTESRSQGATASAAD
jgi:hypothetical protein